MSTETVQPQIQSSAPDEGVIPDPTEMDSRAAEAATFLKALANERRLMILCHLVAGERSVGELEQLLKMRQPALSQQLARLREEGIVATRRESRTIYYRLASPETEALLERLYELFCQQS
ncbi:MULTISPECIES: ArsR/SmtB family transcription factor [unclassified Halorhodospira]|uniref:metalloregulator ArsR/SmtB family transcription factor n=1 Tax=unclassified Halorhodospira TaxID=2626748 RepID=UPI001EE9010F|nr:MULTISPECIES: metalloregulator ArsR/SmtB family transcription factor [unclassified Halorhodospira]MCG5540508.1 metalloregulator ArsR/SmtB family transcription factor [Halorhodospira sp. M39old]MCG5544996.1 metalloregulator ArsR/SmtB family transcription factor [Halorhodospira sp. M38]